MQEQVRGVKGTTSSGGDSGEAHLCEASVDHNFIPSRRIPPSPFLQSLSRSTSPRQSPGTGLLPEFLEDSSIRLRGRKCAICVCVLILVPCLPKRQLRRGRALEHQYILHRTTECVQPPQASGLPARCSPVSVIRRQHSGEEHLPLTYMLEANVHWISIGPGDLSQKPRILSHRCFEVFLPDPWGEWWCLSCHSLPSGTCRNLWLDPLFLFLRPFFSLPISLPSPHSFP